tara:strand:- start:831 stop:1466 length:636 start_codon:yes stop_codon:yes gene_type:complete
MSEIRTTKIIGETGVDAVNFTRGLNVTGISTATNVSTASSVTANAFFGNGAGLTGISAGKLLRKTAYTITRQSISPSQFPQDDTIPQISEGTQFFSQAYTPSTANCDLIITANCSLREHTNVSNMHAMALFINDSTDALRVVSGYTSGGSPVHGDNFTLVHKMASWGVSAKTFSLRASEANAINYAAYGYAREWWGATTHASLFFIEEIAT